MKSSSLGARLDGAVHRRRRRRRGRRRRAHARSRPCCTTSAAREPGCGAEPPRPTGGRAGGRAGAVTGNVSHARPPSTPPRRRAAIRGRPARNVRFIVVTAIARQPPPPCHPRRTARFPSQTADAASSARTNTEHGRATEIKRDIIFAVPRDKINIHSPSNSRFL